MSLISKIESILFVASKPLSISTLARTVEKNEVEVEEAVDTLRMKYNHPESGIHLLVDGKNIQLSTNPEHGELIRGFLKQEIAGELTKAQLETLTVIAYRGPVSRGEIEQIRGINCAVILRNLLIRGLIEEQTHDTLVPLYAVSFEALSHLGIHSVQELPDYETLHAHEYIQAALTSTEEAINPEGN